MNVTSLLALLKNNSNTYIYLVDNCNSSDLMSVIQPYNYKTCYVQRSTCEKISATRLVADTNASPIVRACMQPYHYTTAASEHMHAPNQQQPVRAIAKRYKPMGEAVAGK